MKTQKIYNDKNLENTINSIIEDSMDFLADDIFNQSPFTHLSIFVLKDQLDVQNREYFSFPLIDEGIKSFHNQ